MIQEKTVINKDVVVSLPTIEASTSSTLAPAEKEEIFISSDISQENYMNDLLDMREYLIKNSYNFDYLRYHSLEFVIRTIKAIYYKTFIYENFIFLSEDLNYSDIEDYKVFVQCILNQPRLKISSWDIIKIHETIKYL